MIAKVGKTMEAGFERDLLSDRSQAFPSHTYAVPNIDENFNFVSCL
jgi:hypothetical protein